MQLRAGFVTLGFSTYRCTLIQGQASTPPWLLQVPTGPLRLHRDAWRLWV